MDGMVGRGRAQNIVVSAVAVLVLLACEVARAQTEAIEMRFALNRDFDGLSAPFLLALEKGYYREAGLSVSFEPGNGLKESLSSVASGQQQIGLADTSALVRFRDANADSAIQAVMMINDIAPYAIIGRKSRGISGLSDLAGKRLGGTPTDTAFALWPFFAGANGIDRNGVTIEGIGFAMRGPLLAQGQVDAVFGSAFSLPAVTIAEGVPADDLSVILMSKHGLDFYGDAVVVNPEFAKAQPEAVKGFLAATIRGFLDAIADPDGSLDPVLWRNYDLRRSVEAERLRFALEETIATDWVRANGIGGADMDRLARSMAQLALAYGLGGQAKAEDIFTDAFLPPQSERRVP